MKNLSGQIIRGRGVGKSHIADNLDELRRATGELIIPGTLNCLLDRPIRFDEGKAILFDDGARMLWRIELNGLPVWAYRWRVAPLHVVEILAPVHLRTELGIDDGCRVLVSLISGTTLRMSLASYVAWFVCWFGRRRWVYTNDQYYFSTKTWCVANGATQQASESDLKKVVMSVIKQMIKRIPVVGPVAAKLRSRMQGDSSATSSPPQYCFEREQLEGDSRSDGFLLSQIKNILNYTKTSGTTYAASKFPGAYHTVEVCGVRLQGQRDPAQRLSVVPFNFAGKTMLDIGCNQGGMVYEKSASIRHGVGIDYDPKMINAANKIKSARKAENVDFYVFDLEKDPLNLIRDMLPEGRVDIVFLLSVCMWISNWKDVVRFASTVADNMLFETNGTAEQQDAQVKMLSEVYEAVAQLKDTSDDDPGTAIRRLYFCSTPRAA